jgi:hypothetical protein
MRTLILTLTLLIISGERLFSQPIVWDKTRPLTYTDFRGKPHNSTSVAATFCGIETRVCKKNFWTGKITIEVEATFYPDTSWYLADKVHNLTLRHEQGHFDIAEWFSRKLRRIIEDEIKSVNDYNLNFQSTYDKLYKEYYLTQQKYERETGFGTELDGQLKWEMIIQMKLNSFDAYKNNGCQQRL